MIGEVKRRTPTMAPTKKQNQVLEALQFLIKKGEMPTVREVGALVGLNSSSTVQKHLDALQREGLISMSGKSRGIRLRDDGAGEEPASMSTVSMSPGSMSAGSMSPGSMSAGSMSPGSMSPGSMSPGSMSTEHGIQVVGRIAAGHPIEAVAEMETSEGE